MKKIIVSLLVSFFAFTAAMSAQTTTTATTPKGVQMQTAGEMAEYPAYPEGNAAWEKYLDRNLKVAGTGERKSGTVTIYFIVDEQGTPSGHKVFKSMGDANYDNAALEAVKNVARWTPGKLAGKTRKMGHKIDVKF